MSQLSLFGRGGPVSAPESSGGSSVVRWRWGQHRAALAPGWHTSEPMPDSRARSIALGMSTRRDVDSVEVVPARE